ncbi:MAG: cytidylyltransferase domain-containing protein [Lachnospirales bacterium]
MKTGAIVSARMDNLTCVNSNILRTLKDKSVLEHFFERILQAHNIKDIIVITSDLEEDDNVFEMCKKLSIKCYRDKKNDILSSFYHVSKENEIDIIVKISPISPVIDPFVVDSMIDFFELRFNDVVTTADKGYGNRTFPRGFDVDVFAFKDLENAFNKVKDDYQKIDFMSYIFENTDKIFTYRNKVDFSKYDLSIENDETFNIMEGIYNKLYDGKHNFYLDKVVDCISN